ncbi:MAG: RNA polymerase sigma factor [Proteobacteria bacterium]|nr:RNA polymerase sigma factor [Pseudomonadota bacterium]
MKKSSTKTENLPEILKGPAEQCPDFAELVKQSSPDESLFEQIVACFSDRLTNFAKYYCRDDNLGKDAFQEAMISTMTYLDTYRGDSPIEPWLRRIVTSACSRLRRGKINDPSINIPIAQGEEGPILADSAPNQELRLIIAERMELVYREIDKLKEPNRSLLMLHDVKEVPISALTDQFDMTEEAVKSRLKRSRAEVRSQLLNR